MTALESRRPGDLFGRRHRELVARDYRRKPARLEFILERREFGLGALHDGVGAADRIGEGFVAEIVETGDGGSFEGSHDRTSSVRLWLGPVWKLALPIGLFLC